MTKFIETVFHFLVVSLVAASFGICSAQETTLRVMSFNIRHGEGMDGKINLAKIASIIQEGNPDLVALQGVDRGTRRTKKADQARLLAAQLKMNYVFAKTQNEDGGETGNAILSRFPIGPHKVLQLPKTSDNERAILVAIIKTGKGKKGKEIRFASTALGGGNSGQIRQLDKMNGYFFIEGEETPVIIGTHLYMTSESRSVVEIRKQWTDSFDVVSKEETGETKKDEGPVDKRVTYIFFRADDPIKVTQRRIWADPLLPYPAVLSVLVL